MYPLKKNVDNSFIHCCQNSDAASMSFSMRTDKSTDNGILLSTKKKGTVQLQKDLQKHEMWW